MIYRYLFYQNYEPAEWRVTYVYQHLVLRSLLKKFEAVNLPPDLIGFATGETFHATLAYIEAIFYHKESSRYFLEFMKNPSISLAKQDVQNAVAALECQNFASATYDLERLRKALQALEKMPWLQVRETTSQLFPYSTLKKPKVIKIKPAIRSFQKIKISIDLSSKYYNKNSALLILFTHLSSILFDAIYYQLYKVTPYNDTILRFSDRYIRFARTYAELIVPKVITEETIEKVIEKALLRLKDPSYFTFIKNQLVNWANDDAMQLRTGIDHFRYNGILIGGKDIKKLATPENSNEVIDNLRVKIKLIKPNKKKSESRNSALGDNS